MGKRFSVIVTDREAAEYERDVVESHGYDSNLASFQWIGIHACDLYPEKTPPEELQRRTVEQARKCIEEDHAEVLTTGCTILGAVLTDTAQDLLSAEVEVPIIDPMHAGLKACEMRVDLRQKGGYPAVSRVGRYRRQPHDEFEQLRQWLRTHDSPEQHYIEERDLKNDEPVSSFVDKSLEEASGSPPEND